MTYPLERAEDLYMHIIMSTFYKHVCKECNNTIIVDTNDCEHILFEPKEVEETYMTFEPKDVNNKKIEIKEETRKVLRSSDFSKDVFKCKCPICGNDIIISRDDFYNQDNRCAFDGKRHKLFMLSETETKRAEEFRKKHDHSEEFMKTKGTPFFSTLGQQFSYTFIPGGIGTAVTIRCNHCHESEDITDDDW